MYEYNVLMFYLCHNKLNLGAIQITTKTSTQSKGRRKESFDSHGYQEYQLQVSMTACLLLKKVK